MSEEIDTALANELIKCKSMMENKVPGAVRNTKSVIGKLKRQGFEGRAIAVQHQLDFYKSRNPGAS